MSYLVTWTSPLREFSRPSLIFLCYLHILFTWRTWQNLHMKALFLWKILCSGKIKSRRRSLIKKKHLWIRLSSHFSCAVASDPINSIEELLVVSRLKGSWHFLKRKLAKIIFIKNRICSALFWCIDLVSTTQQITQ